MYSPFDRSRGRGRRREAPFAGPLGDYPHSDFGIHQARGGGNPYDPRGGFPGFPSRGAFPGFPAGPGFPPGPGFPGRPGDDHLRDHLRDHRRGQGRGYGRRGSKGGRQRRGNVRAAVLTLLVERPMHGYEMIQEITGRSGGFWRPSPGSVYPTLQMLADEGLVEGNDEAGGRRLFSLTESGKTEAEKIKDSPPWDEVTGDLDPNEVDLRTAGHQLMTALVQVSQAADSNQKARAVKLLTETRQQLYLILAETGLPDSDDSDGAEDGIEDGAGDE